MKFFIILFAICVTIVATSTDSIDRFKVKPLHINPSIPSSAQGAPEGRITNGQLAAPKQFPYQAGLIAYATQGTYWCGGSIISDRWVLTAAVCTDDVATGVEVYLGAWNRLNLNDNNLQIIFVGKNNVIVHEGWNSITKKNDIALIKLPNPVQFNDYIQPIKLPTKGWYPNDDYIGALTITSGWGHISDDATSITDILRWIEAPVIWNEPCMLYYLGFVTFTNLCTKTTGGFSTCIGDSGGPLVTTIGNEPILIGITSFGNGLGCEINWPAVFTRTDFYRTWIEQHSGVSNT